MSNDVVYEHPNYLVDERAKFLGVSFYGQPLWRENAGVILADGFAPDVYRNYLPNIFSDGPPWRRLIRLSDPAYYCAENPHTDAQGHLRGAFSCLPGWLDRDQRVRVWYRDKPNPLGEDKLALHVVWPLVYKLRVLQSPQDAAMWDAIAEELVKDILGLMGVSTEDIFGIVPDPNPKLHRTNKFRQRRRVLARGPVGLRDTVLQQYWESEDGEHGEWRDVPTVGGSFSDV